MKINKKDISIIIIVSVLLIIAYIGRLPADIVPLPEVLGMVRVCIYLGLFFCWGISLRNRIIQTQARRYFTSVAFLMVFWFLIRTAKYHWIPSELYPNLCRYAWYLYYLPMLLIPLLMLLIALLLGKSEDYRLSPKRMIFVIPTVLLFLMVLTNDFHQLVFTFPAEAKVWSDHQYEYNIGYFLIFGWIVLCACVLLKEIFGKCRIPESRRRIWIPCIPIVLLLLYVVMYRIFPRWIDVYLGDMPAVMCLLYALTLESFIQCGFILANTHYRELFDASTVGAQITDDHYRILLSSKLAVDVDQNLLYQTEEGPVMLSGGIRLCGAPVQGGHVIWTEDLSELYQVLDELNEAREDLKGTNDILEEENRIKIREAHIEEQNRLYNIIQRDTAAQIRQMDELIEQAERSEKDEEKRKLLKKMLVIGAYLKRRSNLVFLADKMPKLDARELEFTFRESLDNLEMYGVVCGLHSELTEPFPAVCLMKMYDFFEEIVEDSLDAMSSLTVWIGKREQNYLITINTDAEAKLSDLISDMVRREQDEDGEWKFSMCLNSGGDTHEPI